MLIASRLSPLQRHISLALIVGLLISAGQASAGTWKQVVNPNPKYYSGTMLLLTDGTVMVQSTYDYVSWTKLTPDATGSYVNGTWTTLAPMTLTRKNFASIVMPDGRVLVLGGEFSGSNLSSKANNTNRGEIYDPVTNKWKRIANFPEQTFGAAPAVLRPSSYSSSYWTILAGSPATSQTYEYDPQFDQ